jgi:type II secretory pathway pseudopilin PulG
MTAVVRRRAEHGISLVEATMILAVMALLTALTAPAIGGFINEGNQTKAAEDVKVIGVALQRMLRDTGETMALANGASTSSGFGPSHSSSNGVPLLGGEGATPAAAVARGGLTNWDSSNGSPAAAIVSSLAGQLTTNTAGYRTLTGMSVTGNFDPSGGATFNSKFGWRGAYLPDNAGPDPWGRRYAVNAEFLGRISGSTSGAPNQVNADNDVIVISAGPNRVVDTAFASTATTAAGDDVLYVVSGSAPR